MRNIKQNLFWAFIYNSMGVPLAAGILYPFFGILLSPNSCRCHELQLCFCDWKCAEVKKDKTLNLLSFVAQFFKEFFSGYYALFDEQRNECVYCFLSFILFSKGEGISVVSNLIASGSNSVSLAAIVSWCIICIVSAVFSLSNIESLNS